MKFDEIFLPSMTVVALAVIAYYLKAVVTVLREKRDQMKTKN